ncbi:MAG: mechanosensitive ion channel domain-containing protein [Chitinophagales bacterium]
MQGFFDSEFLHNTIRQWTWLAGVILFVILFKKYISKMISLLLFKIVEKTEAGDLVEEFLRLILKPLQYFIVLQTIYFGVKTLHYPFVENDEVVKSYVISFLYGAYRLLLIFNAAWIVSRIGDFFVLVLKHRAAKTEDPWDDQLVVFLKDLIRMLVWTIAFLSVLGVVFGVNIYSIVAGAGIAGIAIAFAAQETLQNVFGSISIFTEKPFVIGDLIETEGITGKVVKVGFRSTRVRTIDTAYMTIPNKNIVNNKLSNLTRRTSRRIILNLGLSYNTTSQQLLQIVNEIRTYGENHPQKNEEINVAVNNFGTYAIEVLVEMHFNYMEWEKYVVLRNEVLLKINDIVKNNEAEFAVQSGVVK